MSNQTDKTDYEGSERSGNPERSHKRVLDERLVALYGPVAALLLERLIFLIDKNMAEGRNQKDGRTWSFNTSDEIAQQIGCGFNGDTIDRAVKKLRECNVILVEKGYNKMGADRTRWFAFVDEVGFLSTYKARKDAVSATKPVTLPVHAVTAPEPVKEAVKVEAEPAKEAPAKPLRGTHKARVDELEGLTDEQKRAWDTFADWFKRQEFNHLPRLEFQMKPAELIKLLEKFNAQQVAGILTEMDNWKPITKKSSVYKTALTWLNRNEQRNPGSTAREAAPAAPTGTRPKQSPEQFKHSKFIAMLTELGWDKVTTLPTLAEYLAMGMPTYSEWIYQQQNKAA